MDRKEKDALILGEVEKIEQYALKLIESLESELKDDLQQVLVLQALKKIQTSRRSIEEISRPCRLLLEHFSFFQQDYSHSVGYKVGQYLEGRAVFMGFILEEWGNVVLNLGNIRLKWRDEDYFYLFYPDKIMLKSKNRTNPDIYLSFTFSLNYTKVHKKFEDIQSDEQVEYWHEDID